MKTFPDFTWEYITTICASWINYEQEELTLDPASQMNQSALVAWEGLLAVVTKLREHPEIEKLVPLMQLSYLYWFPSENHVVDLHYDQNKTEYILTVGTRTPSEGTSIDVREAVPIDQVADKIYTYITKLRDD